MLRNLIDKFMLVTRNWAMTSPEKATQILKELNGVRGNGELREQVELTCSALLDKKHYIISELSELEKLATLVLERNVKGEAISSVVNRIEEKIQVTEIDLDELSEKLHSISNQDSAWTGVYEAIVPLCSSTNTAVTLMGYLTGSIHEAAKVPPDAAEKALYELAEKLPKGKLYRYHARTTH